MDETGEWFLFYMGFHNDLPIIIIMEWLLAYRKRKRSRRALYRRIIQNSIR